MTFIRGLTSIVSTSPNIICSSNTDLANIVINEFIHAGTIAIVNSLTQFYWDPTNTGTPSSTVIKPNDGTDPGRWIAANFGSAITSGAVIIDGGSTTNNLRANRPSNQSPIDNTKNGIVNLGSKSTGATVGATGTYTTIAGGDQNTASGDYSVVSGGLLNTASNTGAVVAGGSNNTASGQYSHAVGNLTLASGKGSHAQGISSIASFTGSSAQASGIFSTAGDAQTLVLTSYGAITNSLTEIFIDNSVEKITLPNNAVYGFKVYISAYCNISFSAGYWEFSGAAKTNGSGVMSLVGGSVDKLAIKDDATWDADVDVSASYIRIRVKGDAGLLNNRAVARIELVQMHF